MPFKTTVVHTALPQGTIVQHGQLPARADGRCLFTLTVQGFADPRGHTYLCVNDEYFRIERTRRRPARIGMTRWQILGRRENPPVTA